MYMQFLTNQSNSNFRQPIRINLKPANHAQPLRGLLLRNCQLVNKGEQWESVLFIKAHQKNK